MQKYCIKLHKKQADIVLALKNQSKINQDIQQFPDTIMTN